MDAVLVDAATVRLDDRPKETRERRGDERDVDLYSALCEAVKAALALSVGSNVSPRLPALVDVCVAQWTGAVDQGWRRS